MERSTAVVLGASPTGLYAARELSAAGFRVALADLERGCAWFSRHVTGGRFTGSIDAALDWAIEVAARREAPAVLVPTSDVFLEGIIRRNSELSHSLKLFGAYRAVADRLLDKLSFWNLCQEHGVEAPKVWKVEAASDIRALIDELSFPCILKPELIHRARSMLAGKKVLLVRSPEALIDLVVRLPDDVGGWLIQEIIPGPESEITLVAAAFGRNGRLLQKFSGRKLRQYSPGFGSASLVSARRCEESERLALGFLEAIGFRGVCGAEFKRDSRDGRLKMIEINPRPTLWFQITHDAGLSLIGNACQDLCELQPEGASVPSQATDVVWRYILKDLASARFYRRHAEELPFPPPDISGAKDARIQSWPVFCATDPLPALAEPFGYLKKARKRSR